MLMLEVNHYMKVVKVGACSGKRGIIMVTENEGAVGDIVNCNCKQNNLSIDTVFVMRFRCVCHQAQK